MKIKNSTSAALLALAVCILFLIVNSFDFYLSNTGSVYITVIVLQIVVFLLPALLYCRIKGASLISHLKIRIFSGSGLVLSLLASAAMILFSLLSNFLRVKLGGDVAQYSLYRNLLLPTGDGVGDTAAAVLAFALVPCVCEEFLFRSVISAEYEEKGIFTAVTMSTLLFAIVHFSLEKLPEYLVCGIILSLLCYVTGSVLASATAHFLYNLFCLFGLDYVNRVITHLQSLDLLIFISVVLLLLVLALAFAVSQRMCERYDEQNKKPEYLENVNFSEKASMRFFSSLTSFPMLACLLLFFAAAYQIL